MYIIVERRLHSQKHEIKCLYIKFLDKFIILLYLEIMISGYKIQRVNGFKTFGTRAKK